jgi:hypothetical protein
MKKKAIHDADFIKKLQAQLESLRGELDLARRAASQLEMRRASTTAVKPTTSDAQNQTDVALWKRFTLLTMGHAHGEEQPAPVNPEVVEVATQTVEAEAQKEGPPPPAAEMPKPKEKKTKKKSKSGSSPMTKYKGSKTPMAVNKVLAVIYDMWEKKLVADKIDDDKGNRRDNMGPYVFEYLMGVFGLKKLAEKNAKDIVAAIMLNEKQGEEANRRIQIFGVMTGILRPELYSPKLADIVLQIVGRLVPNWKAIGEYLDHRDFSELLFSKVAIRKALFGGDGRSEKKAQSKEAHAKAEVRRLSMVEQEKGDGKCRQKANCCMLVGLLQDLDLTKELDTMTETIMKPVEEGGCCRNDSAKKNSDGEMACVDADLMFTVVLKQYSGILQVERDALEAVAVQVDLNHDDSIELDEFRMFTSAIMPGHFDERRLVKLFNHMCHIFISDDHEDDTVTYYELSLYCVSHGLYVSPAWKKLAKDFIL